MSKKYYSLPQPSDFSEISHEKTDYESCSPTFIDKMYYGVAINSPESLSLEKINDQLFVCSTYSYSADDVQDRNKSFENTITFGVVELDTYKFSTTQYYSQRNEINGKALDDLMSGLGDDGFGAEIDSSLPSGISHTGWLNINLATSMNMDLKPRRLAVFATVDGFKSNVRIINILDATDISDKPLLGAESYDYNGAEDLLPYELIEEAGEYYVRGRFVIDEMGKQINLHKIKHKALMILVSSGYDYRTIDPYKDAVLFEDDLKQSGDNLIGDYKVNISKHIVNMPGKTLNVLIVFGPYLSKIVTFDIAPR